MCWDQLFSSSFTQKGLSFPYLPLFQQRSTSSSSASPSTSQESTSCTFTPAEEVHMISLSYCTDTALRFKRISYCREASHNSLFSHETQPGKKTPCCHSAYKTAAMLPIAAISRTILITRLFPVIFEPVAFCPFRFVNFGLIIVISVFIRLNSYHDAPL